MKLRIATYNLNNLFTRPRLLELPGFDPHARVVLDDISRLGALLDSASYAGETGVEILKLARKYKLHTSAANQWFEIIQTRAKLFKTSGGTVQLAASGRTDWVGWIELKREQVSSDATLNTGRVIAAQRPDILAVVEAEDRPSLERFNKQVLAKFNVQFPHFMLIDGNDPRGIDVGLYSRFPIESMRSHVDDTYTTPQGKKSRTFSRDCPEFSLTLGDGRKLSVLVNHFKSQGYGTPAANDNRRLQQSTAVGKILADGYNLQTDLVVVAGDLNKVPTHASVAPLVTLPNLVDILGSPLLQGSRSTYFGGNQQLDYVLLSKPLAAGLQAVGVERRGWFKPSVNPFPEVKGPATQASDHALVWAEVDV